MPDIHLQRCPCPRHSLRTIQTDATWTTETLCCPECEHVWDHVQRSDADRVDSRREGREDSAARASAAASHPVSPDADDVALFWEPEYRLRRAQPRRRRADFHESVEDERRTVRARIDAWPIFQAKRRDHGRRMD
jgi:hypothetical protein